MLGIRTQRDKVLSDELRTVAITATNPQGGDPELMKTTVVVT
jgi:hypothetical protein